MGRVEGTTIREIVRNDHRAAAVFEKYAIDFCCGGNRSLDAACAQKGVDPAMIRRELRGLEMTAGNAQFRPGEWDLDALADFIVNNHHRYVRRILPLILTHLNKVVAAHGGNHPELSDIAARFHLVADELSRHMQKEELVLFPYIRMLVASSRSGGPVTSPMFESIRQPIQMMEAEHQSAGDTFNAIRGASQDFAPPPDACETYRVTYRELEEFERDLHQHVHLENNVLFPGAIELEDNIRSAHV
jgi:regulator of cell morphogenesis and NO signaling